MVTKCKNEKHEEMQILGLKAELDAVGLSVFLLLGAVRTKTVMQFV
jgi:hypothetical protein